MHQTRIQRTKTCIQNIGYFRSDFSYFFTKFLSVARVLKWISSIVGFCSSWAPKYPNTQYKNCLHCSTQALRFLNWKFSSCSDIHKYVDAVFIHSFISSVHSFLLLSFHFQFQLQFWFVVGCERMVYSTFFKPLFLYADCRYSDKLCKVLKI